MKGKSPSFRLIKITTLYIRVWGDPGLFFIPIYLYIKSSVIARALLEIVFPAFHCIPAGKRVDAAFVRVINEKLVKFWRQSKNCTLYIGAKRYKLPKISASEKKEQKNPLSKTIKSPDFGQKPPIFNNPE